MCFTMYAWLVKKALPTHLNQYYQFREDNISFSSSKVIQGNKAPNWQIYTQ